MDPKHLSARVGFPLPPSIPADATAVKRPILPTTDAELAQAAIEGRRDNPPAPVSDDEVRANQGLDTADSLVALQRSKPFLHEEDSVENRLRDKVLSQGKLSGLAKILRANFR